PFRGAASIAFPGRACTSCLLRASRLRVSWQSCLRVLRVLRGESFWREMSEGSPSALVDQTEVGSYFVATYPPFSVWSPEAVERDAKPALQQRPDPAVPLGLYLHIPFCRKRCHFCYFRVYTDKNAQEIGRYLDVLGRE